MILGEGGDKMSKSRGNVINPNDIIDEYGADTLRLYIMFIGDFEKAVPWSSVAVKGCKRFLDRIWNLAEAPLEGDSFSKANEAEIHKAIKKVGEDIESMKFNTAIATLMSLVNTFYENKPTRGDIKALILMLSPFAPHFADELWEIQGCKGYACLQPWPKYDEAKTIDAEKEIAVQVGGKLKTTVIIPVDADDETVKAIACRDEKIARLLEDSEIVKTIIVKNKLINLILKPKS